MELNDYLWKARIYHDNAVTKQIEEDLQVMVRAIIGEKKLEIKESKDGFDMYQSCHNWEKEFCQCKLKKYMGYLSPGGYMFYGDSKIEVYCNVIAKIAGNKIYFPYSTLPTYKKKDDDE